MTTTESKLYYAQFKRKVVHKTVSQNGNGNVMVFHLECGHTVSVDAAPQNKQVPEAVCLVCAGEMKEIKPPMGDDGYFSRI